MLKASAMRRYMLWLSMVMLAVVGVVWAAPSAQVSNLAQFALDTRADLELLANEALGAGARPEGWTFNVNNVNSPTFIADLWFDTELLAQELFGENRPDGWVGAPGSSNPVVVVSGIRSDLERMADAQLGFNNRPEGWRGASAIFRCSRTLQNLVSVLRSQYIYNFTTPETAVNYCNVIAGEAETQVLNAVFSSPEIVEQTPDLILAVRGDLERLADERLGLNTRPPGWIGNKEITSPTLASDIFLDLELLADNLLNPGVRPQGWLGVIPNAPYLAYRNLRHDLELLADEVGQIPRPRGWQNVDPLAVCEPALQNLAAVQGQLYGFSTESIPVAGDFCAQAALQANQLAENPPAPEAGATSEADRFTAESQMAFTYLDPAATQYMGIMPAGTLFKAWYRNFGDSTMMFVSGDDFAVYIDRRWTTLSQEIYDRLPTTEGVKPLTFCDAVWCNGPGPTPTPTGVSAIEALLDSGTPIATPNINEVQGEKRQVSWNNIRVTYLLDNAQTRTVQVALEICQDATQTDCEPVVSIFDNATGAPKPILSQSNGLNVFEFPYGYSSGLLIEGETLFSPDIWISDPTIR